MGLVCFGSGVYGWGVLCSRIQRWAAHLPTSAVQRHGRVLNDCQHSGWSHVPNLAIEVYRLRVSADSSTLCPLALAWPKCPHFLAGS